MSVARWSCLVLLMGVVSAENDMIGERRIVPASSIVRTFSRQGRNLEPLMYWEYGGWRPMDTPRGFYHRISRNLFKDEAESRINEVSSNFEGDLDVSASNIHESGLESFLRNAPNCNDCHFQPLIFKRGSRKARRVDDSHIFGDVQQTSNHQDRIVEMNDALKEKLREIEKKKKKVRRARRSTDPDDGHFLSQGTLFGLRKAIVEAMVSKNSDELPVESLSTNEVPQEEKVKRVHSQEQDITQPMSPAGVADLQNALLKAIFSKNDREEISYEEPHFLSPQGIHRVKEAIKSSVASERHPETENGENDSLLSNPLPISQDGSNLPKSRSKRQIWNPFRRKPTPQRPTNNHYGFVNQNIPFEAQGSINNYNFAQNIPHQSVGQFGGPINDFNGPPPFGQQIPQTFEKGPESPYQPQTPVQEQVPTGYDFNTQFNSQEEVAVSTPPRLESPNSGIPPPHVIEQIIKEISQTGQIPSNLPPELALVIADILTGKRTIYPAEEPVGQQPTLPTHPHHHAPPAPSSESKPQIRPAPIPPVPQFSPPVGHAHPTQGHSRPHGPKIHAIPAPPAHLPPRTPIKTPYSEPIKPHHIEPAPAHHVAAPGFQRKPAPPTTFSKPVSPVRPHDGGSQPVSQKRFHGGITRDKPAQLPLAPTQQSQAVGHTASSHQVGIHADPHYRPLAPHAQVNRGPVPAHDFPSSAPQPPQRTHIKRKKNPVPPEIKYAIAEQTAEEVVNKNNHSLLPSQHVHIHHHHGTKKRRKRPTAPPKVVSEVIPEPVHIPPPQSQLDHHPVPGVHNHPPHLHHDIQRGTSSKSKVGPQGVDAKAPFDPQSGAGGVHLEAELGSASKNHPVTIDPLQTLDEDRTTESAPKPDISNSEYYDDMRPSTETTKDKNEQKWPVDDPILSGPSSTEKPPQTVGPSDILIQDAKPGIPMMASDLKTKHQQQEQSSVPQPVFRPENYPSSNKETDAKKQQTADEDDISAGAGAIHFQPIQTNSSDPNSKTNNAQLYHAYYAPAHHDPPPGYIRMTVDEFNKLFKDAEIQFIGSEQELQKKLGTKPTNKLNFDINAEENAESEDKEKDKESQKDKSD